MLIREYELGIEEVAYAMGVLGGTEIATGFLLALLGERPRLETEGRLLAASHALVARGYLDFNPDTGEKWLGDGLEEVIRPIVQNDFSIRCSKAASGHETVLSLYISKGELVMHRLHREVVSRLEQIPDASSAQEQCLKFFGLPTDTPAPQKPLATFSADLIDRLRQEAIERPTGEIASQLVEHGVSADAAAKLSEDIKQQEYRGSVIRIEMQGGQAVSNRGFLILQASERAWIMNIEPSTPPKMSLYPGCQAVFTELFSALVT